MKSIAPITALLCAALLAAGVRAQDAASSSAFDPATMCPTSDPAWTPAPVSEAVPAASAAAPAASAAAPAEPSKPAAPAAATAKGRRAIPAVFAVPDGLRDRVEFWKNVYSKWSSREVALHDRRHLGVVFEVLDTTRFELPDSAPVLDRAAAQQAAEGFVDGRRAPWDEALRELASCRAPLLCDVPLEPDPRGVTAHGTLSAQAQRALALYRAAVKAPLTPALFQDSVEAGGVRGQRGLADRFRAAVIRSGRYLDAFEKIFEDAGLPPLLARIAFVESMFVNESLSRVGAAGLYQFMPGSARMYGLAIDAVHDERLDPWKAAHGATRLFKQAYELLGKWPLAITAYNHGPAGMARAVRAVGSNDLSTIVAKYRGSKSFGFASRNFYAEFLAALDVSLDYETHFGALTREPPERFETVTLDAPGVGPQTWPVLAGRCAVDGDVLLRLNPALSRKVTSGQLPLPRGYALRVPTERAEAFRTAYAALAPGKGAAPAAVASSAKPVQPPAGAVTSGGAGDSSAAATAAVAVASATAAPAPAGAGAPREALSTAALVAELARERFAPDSGRIRPLPDETLTHIADWCAVSVDALRTLNGAAARALRAGMPFRLECEDVDRFSDRRAAYHRTRLADYLRAARVEKLADHKIASGDSAATLARRYKTPVWVVWLLNPEVDFAKVRAGSVVKVPIVETTRRS